MNENQLTAVTFPTVTDNPHAFYKDAVNDAYKDIYMADQQWPFNYATGTVILTPGSNFVDWPGDAAHIDWDSFMLSKGIPDSSVPATKLRYIDLNTWRFNFQANDENATASDSWGVPELIFRTKDDKIGVHPKPNKAYQLVYEYYKRFVPLELYTDVPLIPERYDHVLIDGSNKYSYLFREDFQQARMFGKYFNDGIGSMRRELIPQALSLRVR